jgi:hypothetical protein
MKDSAGYVKQNSNGEGVVVYPRNEEESEVQKPHSGDNKWTFLPHIVCAEHPDRLLFQGYPAHAETVVVDPEELREVYHSLTHEELEVIATRVTLYKYVNAEVRHKLINSAGELVKREAGPLLTQTLAQTFRVNPKHLRRVLSEDLKEEYYRELAIRRWKKEANPHPPNHRIT